MSWLYRRAKGDAFEVGFFRPTPFNNGIAVWESVRAFTDEARAAVLVNYLNGGGSAAPLVSVRSLLSEPAGNG